MYSRANNSKSLPQAQATFWLKSIGWSFLRTKLAGVSKGEALVKTAISEAPMVCFRALIQAGVRWIKPVWFSFRKALKVVTRADMIAHTSWRCSFNWLVFVERRTCNTLNQVRENGFTPEVSQQLVYTKTLTCTIQTVTRSICIMQTDVVTA